MSLLDYIAIRYPSFFCRGITRIKGPEKTLYLTFDDGPNPIITEQVLDILQKYNAKASFFCKGSNSVMYPEILYKIKENGHTIGNHSYSNQNAFRVSNKKRLIDCLRKSPVSESFFFRPPYGRIFPWQCRRLRKQYRIVLWDVLTYDFRKDFNLRKVKQIIFSNTRNGSIIVFHDNLQSASLMIKALEFTLQYFSKKGYRFSKI